MIRRLSCLLAAVFGGKIEWRAAVFSLICAVSILPIAQAAETNEDHPRFTVQDPVTLGNANALDVLIYRFSNQVMDSDRTVFDRISGPTAQLGKIRGENRFGGAFYDKLNRDGVGLFSTIGVDSLRIAAVDALPLDMWQNTSLRWLGKLVNGVIGNPEEQHARLTSPSYSAVRSSWENLAGDTGVQWGVRPWNTYPYVYVLAHAGRTDGKPLLTMAGRAGYRFFDAPRIEGRVTFRLPASFRIAGGVGFDPSHAAQQQRGGTEYAITLEKVLRPNSRYDDSVFFVGCRSGIHTSLGSSRRETVALAGLATGW